MIQLETIEKVKGALAPKNRLGQPANVEPGSATILSSDPTVAIVEVDPDDPFNELKFQVVAKKAGACEIIAQADADLDADEVRTIEARIGIHVVEPEAVGFGIELGDPELQTPGVTPELPVEPYITQDTSGNSGQ